MGISAVGMSDRPLGYEPFRCPHAVRAQPTKPYKTKENRSFELVRFVWGFPLFCHGSATVDFAQS
jgi:hypothetical protein